MPEVPKATFLAAKGCAHVLLSVSCPALYCRGLQHMLRKFPELLRHGFFFPSKETSFHNGRNFPKDLDTIYTFLLIFTNQNLNYSAQVSKEYLYNKVLINILLLSYYMRLNRDLPCSSQASKIQILFQKPLPFPRQPRDVLWPPGDPHIAQSPQMHVVQPS